MSHLTRRLPNLVLAITAAVGGMILLSQCLRTPSTSSRDHYNDADYNGSSQLRRRHLSLLSGLQDPKTVELRPINYGMNVPASQSDKVRVDSNHVVVPDVVPSSPIKPYTLEDAINSTNAFRYTLFFFVYDASSDTFFVVHNIPGCTFGCDRIHRVASILSYAFRKNFPDRFQGEHDLVIMLSCGDSPRIKQSCIFVKSKHYCGSADFAPILQFGSVFVNTNYLPSMIAMPQPVRPHLPCFDDWQISDFGKLKGVCEDIQPPDYNDITRHDDYWDNLIPQVIWRGSDFYFLHTLFPEMRPPSFELDIPQNKLGFDGLQFENEYERKRWAIETLQAMGDEKLLPRWKGVLMTSEAELESSRVEPGRTDVETKIPWVNIKFTHINDAGEKIPVGEKEEYQTLQSLGISCIGDYVSMSDQAKYKYHIDLGGGGGTTWTGTIQKLALPGVLFHHVTPTKDWFHDLLVPWEHYIPIQTDLSDLREKYEWAESHPEEARRISENGTRFAQWMASAEGFGHLYDTFLLAPLRVVMNAYRNPTPSDYEGKRVLDIILESGKGEFTVVSTCSGLYMNSCTKKLRYR